MAFRKSIRSLPAIEIKLTTYGPPFDDADADVILRSSDDIHFYVYKAILAKASPFFRDILTMGQPKKDYVVDKRASRIPGGVDAAVISVSHTSRTLAHLLTLCYPLDNPVFSTLAEMLVVLEAAKKYDMERAYNVASRSFAQAVQQIAHPAKAFNLACKYRLANEARVAARSCLKNPMSLDDLDQELQYMDGPALHQLWRYHRKCSDAAGSLASGDDYTWITRKDGQIWGWADAGSCVCQRRAVAVANNESWLARSWWTIYMQNAEEALRKRPCGSTVTCQAIMVPSYQEVAQCSYCLPIVVETLLAFSKTFASEVEDRILKIELGLPF